MRNLLKLKRVDSINVIPFIDIMLVLLVIVLTTATFTQKSHIPVALPQAQSAQKSSPKTPHRIVIDKAGTITLDDTAVSIQGLKVALSNVAQTHPIELYGDKKSAFESFVQVMELLTALGHKELFIVTKK